MSHRLERKERARIQKLILKVAAIILISVFAVSLFYLAGRNLMIAYRYHHRDTVLAQYGAIETTLQGQGLVLRREIVYKAPAVGFFENMVSDGSKVKINALLGYYLSRGEKITLRALTSGLFTRQTDGLEGALQDITLSSAGPELFSYRPQHHDPEAEFKLGQGVYKIIDNLAPTRLLLQFSQPKTSFALKENQKASISVNGIQLGDCRVIDYKNDFNKLVVMVETAEFREDLLHERHVNAELTLKSESGYLLPEKSLFNRGPEKGIYCIDGEEIIFKTVQVLTVEDGIAVVEGLLPNDMVITKPDKVKL